MVMTNQINEAEKMYILYAQHDRRTGHWTGLRHRLHPLLLYRAEGADFKEPLDETERLMNTIKLDKDDYHLLRYYNMMVIRRPASLFLQ